MKRIEALSKLTVGIDTLLDIGTDHGYLLIDALSNHHIKRGIAADINEQPLNNAKKNIESAGLSDKVSFALSNGFLNIEDSFDGVAIAGMGMHLVKTILMQPHKVPHKYIVSVHTHIDQFREFLSENGFQIIDEVVVHEKFYYVLFVLVKKFQKLTKEDAYLGPILKRKVESISYYEHLLKLTTNLYVKVPNKRRKMLEVQINWLKNAINSLKSSVVLLEE